MLGGAVLLIVLFWGVEGQLHVNGESKCGQINCGLYSYCRETHNRCEPCSRVCDVNSKNYYQKDECESKCQDYLLDQRYVRKDGPVNPNTNSFSSSSGDVDRLSKIVTALIVLICIVIVIQIGIITCMVFQCKKDNKLNVSSLRDKILFAKRQDPKVPPNGTQMNTKPDFRLEMTASTPTQSEQSPGTAMTTTTIRSPTEDVTPMDYAYDNPALSTTPTASSKPGDRSH